LLCSCSNRSIFCWCLGIFLFSWKFENCYVCQIFSFGV
jgi:hypothetical protein